MPSLLTTTVFLLSDEPGRADDPGGLGGILLIAGIALVAVLVAVALLMLAVRLRREHRSRDEADRAAKRSLPSEHGRPWSSER